MTADKSAVDAKLTVLIGELEQALAESTEGRSPDDGVVFFLDRLPDIVVGLQMLRAMRVAAREEHYLTFLADLKSLVRAEHLSDYDRIGAIDEAITRAIGGELDQAADWARLQAE